jgi:plasmid stabilization system protein ParE
MVIWAGPAKSDLRAIHDFIASDSKYYAKKVVQDIVDRANILEKYPRIGRMAPEIAVDRGKKRGHCQEGKNSNGRFQEKDDQVRNRKRIIQGSGK